MTFCVWLCLKELVLYFDVARALWGQLGMGQLLSWFSRERVVSPRDICCHFTCYLYLRGCGMSPIQQMSFTSRVSPCLIFQFCPVVQAGWEALPQIHRSCLCPIWADPPLLPTLSMPQEMFSVLPSSSDGWSRSTLFLSWSHSDMVSLYLASVSSCLSLEPTEPSKIKLLHLCQLQVSDYKPASYTIVLICFHCLHPGWRRQVLGASI